MPLFAFYCLQILLLLHYNGATSKELFKEDNGDFELNLDDVISDDDGGSISVVHRLRRASDLSDDYDHGNFSDVANSRDKRSYQYDPDYNADYDPYYYSGYYSQGSSNYDKPPPPPFRPPTFFPPPGPNILPGGSFFEGVLLDTPQLPPKEDSFKECEKGLFLIGGLQIKKCGNSLFDLQHISINQPYIVMPGKLSLNLRFVVPKMIDGGVTLSYRLSKLLSRSSKDLHCSDQGGTCKYRAMCSWLFRFVRNCDETLPSTNLPCNCVYPKGEYEARNMEIYVPVCPKIAQIPTSFVNGLYHGRIAFSRMKDDACFDYSFKLMKCSR